MTAGCNCTNPVTTDGESCYRCGNWLFGFDKERAEILEGYRLENFKRKVEAQNRNQEKQLSGSLRGNRYTPPNRKRKKRVKQKRRK